MRYMWAAASLGWGLISVIRLFTEPVLFSDHMLLALALAIACGARWELAGRR